MIIGIILAAGKGTRMNLRNGNKTTLLLRGKPLAQYGIDLFSHITDKTIVVVGHQASSVKNVLEGDSLVFVTQSKRLGTGHAVRRAVETLSQTTGTALVGNGDHLMCYTKEIIQDFMQYHHQEKNTMTILTTTNEDTEAMDNGRILRTKEGLVMQIVEKRDLLPEQKTITEFNSGFYCFDLKFLQRNIRKLEKNHEKNEYYLTDLVKIVHAQEKKVGAFVVPFKFVGTGVNTKEQLEKIAVQGHTDHHSKQI